MGLRLGYGGNSEAHLAGREDFSFHALPADASSPTSLQGISLGQGPADPGRICMETGFPGFCSRVRSASPRPSHPTNQNRKGESPDALASGKSFPLCETLSPRDLVLSLESPSPTFEDPVVHATNSYYGVNNCSRHWTLNFWSTGACFIPRLFYSSSKFWCQAQGQRQSSCCVENNSDDSNRIIITANNCGVFSKAHTLVSALHRLAHLHPIGEVGFLVPFYIGFQSSWRVITYPESNSRGARV